MRKYLKHASVFSSFSQQKKTQDLHQEHESESVRKKLGAIYVSVLKTILSKTRRTNCNASLTAFCSSTMKKDKISPFSDPQTQSVDENEL